MTKKFLVSTADVYGYDSSGTLILSGKTLLDSSIETTLANTDIRAGRGNQLQYVYYHTAEMNIKLTDSQFNLAFIAANVGKSVVTGANVYKQEDVTLTSGGAGTVTGTPLAVSGSTIYGWVTLANGTTEKVTFSSSNFTCSGASGDVVCVRYLQFNAAARSLTIPANIVPSILRLVLEADLASSDDTSANIIGKVQIEVPKATLTGAFTLSLTPDGVASTPLMARAIASNDVIAGCSSEPTFATIKEVLTNAHWYDNVIGLAIVGGDFGLTTGGTKILSVRAIPGDGGAAFSPPVADLTFSSSSTSVATVSSSGLVTYVGVGTSTIKATITAKTTIDANIVVTCS